MLRSEDTNSDLVDPKSSEQALNMSNLKENNQQQSDGGALLGQPAVESPSPAPMRQPVLLIQRPGNLSNVEMRVVPKGAALTDGSAVGTSAPALKSVAPALAQNSGSSTLLLVPVAFFSKQMNRSDVNMRIAPKGVLPGNPGEVSSAFAFKVTTPIPMAKPVTSTPTKRKDRPDPKKPADAKTSTHSKASVEPKINAYPKMDIYPKMDVDPKTNAVPKMNVVIKQEVVSEDSADSRSSDDGADLSPMKAPPSVGEAGSDCDTVRPPLSMALQADQVLLPSPAWNHHDVDMESNARSLCFVELSSARSGLPFTRRILQIVESEKGDYSIRCYVLDREVEVTALPTGSPPPSVDEISETLQDFHARPVCGGALARRDLPGARFLLAWLDKTGVWRHDRCSLLLSGAAIETRCRFCAMLPNPFSAPTTEEISRPKPAVRTYTRTKTKSRPGLGETSEQRN